MMYEDLYLDEPTTKCESELENNVEHLLMPVDAQKEQGRSYYLPKLDRLILPRPTEHKTFMSVYILYSTYFNLLFPPACKSTEKVRYFPGNRSISKSE